MLSREQFLAFKPKSQIVSLDAGDLRVAEMSVSTRLDFLSTIRINLESIEAYDADQAKPEAERTGVAKVEKLDQALVTIIFSIVDEAGARMFTMDDYPFFQTQSFALTMKLWEAVAELGRTASHDAVEDEKKSSGGRRRGNSHSASRSRSDEQSKS